MMRMRNNPLAGFATKAGKTMAACLLALALAGCMVGPDFVKPPVDYGAGYKATGWELADPSMASRPKGSWWDIYQDALLDDLMRRVDVDNLNIAQAEAKYRQAIALLASATAPLMPTVTASGNANRSGGSATSAAGVVSSTAMTTYGATGQASWTIDIWGAVRRNMESQQANMDALAASIGGARLTAQSTLALTYIQLRIVDERARVFASAVASYERSLTLTQNKFDAGVVGLSDVAVARTQLESTRAQLIDTQQQRALLENAIAVLLGVPPSQFSIAPAPFALKTPVVPVVLPARLMQQRPDIANAERLAAAANAQIGVATAAWFPSLTLNATGGYRSNDYLNWFGFPSQFWALGPVLAQTIFDGGARQALIDQNRALFDGSVATYRLTVLQALQQVENALVQLRVFEQEETVQWQAVLAARQAAQLTKNQYDQGIVDYLSVAVLENTALNNENSYVTLLGNRLAASVQLIVALGGGWTEQDIRKLDKSGKYVPDPGDPVTTE